MAWLPDGEKKLEDIFIRFGATHARDGQTDERTPRDGIYRAYAYRDTWEAGTTHSCR